jgi:hypothetical protein
MIRTHLVGFEGSHEVLRAPEARHNLPLELPDGLFDGVLEQRRRGPIAPRLKCSQQLRPQRFRQRWGVSECESK